MSLRLKLDILVTIENGPTDPKTTQSIHLTGVAYQEAD